MPLRYQSEPNETSVLCLAMQNGDIVEEEPGLAAYWVGSEHAIPQPSHNKTVHQFHPQDGRSGSGFAVVAIVQTHVAAVAA